MINRVKTVDWLSTIIYPLAIILMEAFWIYPWLVWLGVLPVFTELRPALSLASVIIVLVLSLLVTRVCLRQKWPVWLIQIAVIGAGLVAILVVIRIEYGAGHGFFDGQWFAYTGQVLRNTFSSTSPLVVAIPVLLYLWWRGIVLGRTTSYLRNIYSSFLLGMIMLIILIIIWHISSGAETIEGPVASIGFYVMAFFFFGLIAMAIYHLSIMRSQMPREDTKRTPAWRWLPIMLGVIGGIVVVGMGIASLFSNEFVASIGRGFGVFFDLLGKLFHYLLIPLNYIFQGIFYVLQIIVEWLRGDHVLEPSGEGAPGGIEGLEEVVPKALPPEVTTAIQWLVIALIIAAVIYFLARAISRYFDRRAREEIEEIHESIWSANEFRDDLRLLLNMLTNKFKRKPVPATLPKYHIDEDASGRLNIREIYRHLLWEGARSGVARQRHETTREYAKRLENAVPDGTEPLTKITDLYVGVRYGETKAKEDQVESANSLWKVLRNLLRGLKKT